MTREEEPLLSLRERALRRRAEEEEEEAGGGSAAESNCRTEFGN